MMKYYVPLSVFVTVILSCNTISTSDSNSEKIVLVFGGTGNIGTELVDHLLEHNYKPVLVSRGYWTFDSATIIKPRVNHIPCDRYKQLTSSPGVNLLTRCRLLKEFIRSEGHIDFVIDLSAFTPEVVEHAIEVFQGRVGLYIYISSDAVYEVCRKPVRLPIKETECVRPEDKKQREILARRDDTGDAKLKIEELLMKQRASGGFPYMSLRLPDVIGPRDTTMRWWSLQLQVKFYHNIHSPVLADESQRDFKSSLVFNKDVAKAIVSAMKAGDIVHDEAYNIGFDESFHYRDIVNSIAKALNVEGIQFEVDEVRQQIYPSVTRGPVDTSKIKEHLGFEPTPWEHAVNETVAWYEKAFTRYSRISQRAIDHLTEHVVPEESRAEFLEAVYKSIPKEEL